VTPFAARLRQALDKLGIGVVACDTRLAAVRGSEKISKGYTTKALKGTAISLDIAESMAVALEVRPAWLLLGEGPMLPDENAPTYGELPGWRIVAAGAVEMLPRGIPPFAIEAAARRPVLAQPKALTPTFVVALAEFWFRYASDAEIEAATAAYVAASSRR
jgi:hypothetical protein